ncbi:hypothetical protein N9D01_00675 [Cyclobacteriaceae bacterium]|nr:hypothetical protein [Cyclobacteriaceae bacterium]MDC1370034.1 hypothetical protein [Cyclobacteriaceae bacterium]MDC6483881.1 hypothetical protein [Cyclobacteriaceae bacterium]
MKNFKLISLFISILFIASIVSCGNEEDPASAVSYSLTVQVDPTVGGSVSQTSETFISGTTATLTATANTNYTFSTWTGSSNSTSNPLELIMNEDKSLVAIFELMDSDQDGITDDLDECPDTAEGSTVDDKGCEEEVVELVEIVWTGDVINFTKADDADPTLEANQDRITDHVWITRDNEEGGQIYNRVSESASDKETSPLGTEWAEGDLDDYASLTYVSFRTATVKPKDAIGKTYVVHLTEDNIYLSVKLISWSSNKAGGFSYERSTE